MVRQHDEYDRHEACRLASREMCVRHIRVNLALLASEACTLLHAEL